MNILSILPQKCGLRGHTDPMVRKMVMMECMNNPTRFYQFEPASNTQALLDLAMHATHGCGLNPPVGNQFVNGCYHSILSILSAFTQGYTLTQGYAFQSKKPSLSNAFSKLKPSFLLTRKPKRKRK